MRTRYDSRKGPAPSWLPLGAFLLLAGCESETLFHGKFDSEAVGAAPSVNQIVGTVSLDEGAGTVRVVGPPPGATTNWAQISHPTAPSPQTAMRCNLSQFKGDGTYGLLAVLFIPSGTGVATIQFEPFTGGPSSYLNFLHLDFMPNNTVRVDDGAAVFGTFPRDQFFTVSVNLEIAPTSAVAHFQLFGANTSGTLDYPLNPGWLVLARQFAAVRFWMGFQHSGSFLVDDIVVTRKTS